MNEKPKLELIGKDGNAFSILGLAGRAAKKAGWPKVLKMENKKCTGYPKEALEAMNECEFWFEVLNKWPLSNQKSIYKTLEENCLIAIELKKKIDEEEKIGG